VVNLANQVQATRNSSELKFLKFNPKV
jgi:hypothetical protein